MSQTALARRAPVAETRTTFTFVCCDCRREENATSRALPPGWDKVTPRAIRCPDCKDMIERAYIAQSARAEPPRTAAATASQSGFHINLERQDSGEYLVAIAPAQILMRWLPLGFFATPDEARALAADLRRYAALAENRGALPEPLDAAS